MAMFLGAKGGDILAWRTVSDLLGTLKGRMTERMSLLLADEEMTLLEGLKELLEEEIGFEERFAEAFSKLLDTIPAAADGLPDLHADFIRMAEGYFARRRSVVTHHSLCAAFHDRFVCKVLKSAEDEMVRNGEGPPPAPYCWFATGDSGRVEGTTRGNSDFLLVFGDHGPGSAAYFELFSRKASDMLAESGLKSRISPADQSWRGSMADWRARMSAEAGGARWHEAMAGLVSMGDIRYLCGDGMLAAEMVNLVRSTLTFHQKMFRTVGRTVSEMPTGLDFFGRLRVEKSGGHRGMFNLEQMALVPLVMNVRILAIKYDTKETNTVERIKELMAGGHLNVELADRLLMAYHNLAGQKILEEIKRGEKGGEGTFLNPEELTERDERNLKSALEAVVNLQRIVYQSFSEQE